MSSEAIRRLSDLFEKEKSPYSCDTEEDECEEAEASSCEEAEASSLHYPQRTSIYESADINSTWVVLACVRAFVRAWMIASVYICACLPACLREVVLLCVLTRA